MSQRNNFDAADAGRESGGERAVTTSPLWLHNIRISPTGLCQPSDRVPPRGSCGTYHGAGLSLPAAHQHMFRGYARKVAVMASCLLFGCRARGLNTDTDDLSHPTGRSLQVPIDKIDGEDGDLQERREENEGASDTTVSAHPLQVTLLCSTTTKFDVSTHRHPALCSNTTVQYRERSVWYGEKPVCLYRKFWVGR